MPGQLQPQRWPSLLSYIDCTGNWMVNTFHIKEINGHFIADINSLNPGGRSSNSLWIFFKHNIQKTSLHIGFEIALWRMRQNFADEKSASVQVMVWSVMQEVITRANIDPDLYSHMVSPGQQWVHLALLISGKSCDWEIRLIEANLVYKSVCRGYEFYMRTAWNMHSPMMAYLRW